MTTATTTTDGSSHRTGTGVGVGVAVPVAVASAVVVVADTNNRTAETDADGKGRSVTSVGRDHSNSSSSSSSSNNNNKVESGEGRDVQCENDVGGTIWELFVTLYLPIAVGMFKYVVLGSVGFVRLSLGVVGRYIVERSSTGSGNNNNSVSKNIVGGAAGGTGTGTAGVDPHEWPQQFLTALGVLTIFALVVHPDGFTWVVLGKIRDSVTTVVSAIPDCWEVLGVFPTIAALMTLSALFFLMYLVVRTLTPKTPKRQSQQTKDKRKKKKKKETKSRGGRRGDNHRNKNRSVPFRIQPRTEQHEDVEERKEEPEKDSDSILTNKSSGSILSPLPELSTSIDDPTRGGSSSRPRSKSSTDSSDTPGGAADDIAAARTTKKRNRVSSSSTQDTTPSLDDISCSSTSVRSYPSVSVSSTRSKDNSRSPKPVGTPSRNGGKSSGARPSKTQGSGGSSKKGVQTEPTTPTAPSSRWDALKPGQKSQHQHDKHFKPGLVQRSSTRRGVNNCNQRNDFKSATYTPPRSGIASANRQQRDVEVRMGGSESCPSPAHDVSLPPPGFQCQSPGGKPDPLGAFDSNSSSRDDVDLSWLRSDASTTGQALVSTPMFAEQSLAPSSSATPSTSARGSDWNDETQLFPSPPRSTVSAKDFPHSSPTILDSSRVGDCTTKPKYFCSSSLKENPFDDSERQVEEELQELEQLGGQMAGSILDFLNI